MEVAIHIRRRFLATALSGFAQLFVCRRNQPAERTSASTSLPRLRLQHVSSIVRLSFLNDGVDRLTGLSTLDSSARKGRRGEQLSAVTQEYAQASSYYGQVFDN